MDTSRVFTKSARVPKLRCIPQVWQPLHYSVNKLVRWLKPSMNRGDIGHRQSWNQSRLSHILRSRVGRTSSCPFRDEAVSDKSILDCAAILTPTDNFLRLTDYYTAVFNWRDMSPSGDIFDFGGGNNTICHGLKPHFLRSNSVALQEI